MNDTILKIGCKINVYLEITGQRPDGFHELRTLFYPLTQPSDTLSLSLDHAREGLELTCSEPDLATPDNLVHLAYARFQASTGFAPGLKAHLSKGIPSGAGLGGGSADAAAMLSWLNAQAGAQALGQPELSALALGLGADVPFFLHNKPCLATGVGEVLQPVDCPQLAGMMAVVAWPEHKVPTAWAYHAWDAGQDDIAVKQTSLVLTSLAQTVKRPFCVSGLIVANSFEAVVFPAFPRIKSLKETLLASGAAAAAMSGSGSAVFGLFHDPDLAEKAKDALVAKSAVVCSVRL